ncbi:MAG: hypothetical protein L0Y56_02525 [Nitrospira sp.]|nr:hypothetical protein [Nitrospira sp.]
MVKKLLMIAELLCLAVALVGVAMFSVAIALILGGSLGVLALEREMSRK